MTNSSIPIFRLLAVFAMMSLLAACGALKPTTTPPPAFYSLDSAGSAVAAPDAKSRRWQDGEAVRPEVTRRGYGEAVRPEVTRRASSAERSPAATLIVSPTHAAAGFDSQRIIYVRKIHQLEYFAHSEWADTPARMIAPLIVATLEGSGTFRAVVLTPSAAAGELRLDTEIVRLQQEFDSASSQVRFTLRASVVDNASRRVLAQREFDETVTAASHDPRGGVAAANRAVHAVLASLAEFCSAAAEQWQASTDN